VIQRPSWLPNYVPELDGLRGIAIGAVLLYHCKERLVGTPLHAVVEWGWAGVNLFFVLSGFLITGILLESRGRERFFTNFYARRALRIWPVYILLLALYYIAVPWTFSGFWWAWHETKSAPWLHYVFFVQNLFVLALPGAIGPTWSLAIEEQFYVVWAPVARFLKPSALMAVLIALLCISPFLRMANLPLSPTHTLLHLDGLAVGSLIAVSLRTLHWPKHVWKKIAVAALVIGGCGAVALLYQGSAFSDSFLALTFGGMLLTAVLGTEKHSIYGSALKWAPLSFLGTISYGLYMTHILTFTVIGAFDRRMDAHGVAGNLAVVAVRLVVSITVATVLWYGFEKPILRLKKHFSGSRKPASRAPEMALEPATAD